MSKMCQGCGNTDITGNKFCNRCGREMVPIPHCVCGVEMWPYKKYCDGCGRSRGEALGVKPEVPAVKKKNWLQALFRG